jgi:hypothetical protein
MLVMADTGWLAAAAAASSSINLLRLFTHPRLHPLITSHKHTRNSNLSIDPRTETRF